MENFGSLILPLLLSALVGYLLGSISFAILLTKAFAHEDVRAHGSGNALSLIHISEPTRHQ